MLQFLNGTRALPPQVFFLRPGNKACHGRSYPHFSQLKKMGITTFSCSEYFDKSQ